ncbi:hypothetical protein KI809_18760 [Geobacter pelophilus]|uniref:Fibronectin type-III domain-containing protein n=1 Tax=Geoanaerobacter pelophilus TaxID=60036 RepID=A0AAW4LEC2_9BACT|nr:hypothetical protein [Geoanaerobacter pelophilus]MBT0666354.1 hypothetical protein [Geoanaerobacter pelophilus]
MMKKTLIALVILWLAVMALFARIACSADFRVKWMPNSEPDLAGYKIHWDKQPVPPFANHSSVGNVTTAVLKGMSNPTYIAITAINSSGLESGYSAIVSSMIAPPAGVRTIVIGGLEIQ